jgi:transposase
MMESLTASFIELEISKTALYNCLIMDNAPIHINEDIKSVIEGRGYRCVYLPPYSLELNPIEQFWSVCKSKLKRERLLEEETLSSRIAIKFF